MRLIPAGAMLAVALLAAPPAAGAQEHGPAPACAFLLTAHGGGAHPGPAYGPDEVIRLQLEALAANDDPHTDAGIEVAFRFASPANKRVTGPLGRFTAMVHNALYRALLNHRAVRYGTLHVDNDHAARVVIVTARDGELVAYLFILLRQRGGACDGCWMTDSVLRLEAEQAQGGGQRDEGGATASISSRRETTRTASSPWCSSRKSPLLRQSSGIREAPPGPYQLRRLSRAGVASEGPGTGHSHGPS